jgi:hypothetical protein
MALIDGFLTSSSPEKTRTALQAVHPLVTLYGELWQTGLDAYDGTGGFLTGEYLWRFPREHDAAYAARREQSRYHNYTEVLADIYVRHITGSVERDAGGDAELQAWWDNVDGRGEPIETYVQAVLGQALAAGHAAVLTDITTAPATGPAIADNPNRPFLVCFSAPAILDWRVDRQGLAAIKLSEAAPIVPLDVEQDTQQRGFLLWDRELWARFDHKGALRESAAHGLGVVPVDLVRPKPSRRHPFIGKALVNPQVVRALYNRASEEDVVLRDQAFSMFVVSVPTDATEQDVENVKAWIGQEKSTTTVMVVKGQADYKTADMAVPARLAETQQRLIHELYRQAHLRFERDSLDAESGEAIRLQRRDLNQALTSMAAEMASFERQIVSRYFAWRFPAQDVSRRLERVQIKYPGKDEFDLVDIEDEVRATAESLALGLGATAAAEMKKRIVSIQLPDLAPETLAVVHDEIDALATAPADGADLLRTDARRRLESAGITVAA